MDTTPVYELRERLRAAALAGTNLLSEDFRLKRAYESFQSLEKVSLVFAKIGQSTGQLLSPECHSPQSMLLETISLVDSVVCTLAAVDMAGKVEPVGLLDLDTDGTIVDVPYSVLTKLLEALTMPGGSHYATVCDTQEKHPEFFRDYRVKNALVQALGSCNADIADKAEQLLTKESDRSVLPVLYRDFDPKGEKEMARRVRVISRIGKARANAFYVRMLGEAQKDVRLELIDALRYDSRNLPLLFELSRTEKGKNKDKVYEILTEIQDERVKDFFEKLAEKKLQTVLKYIRNAVTDWSAELMADICETFIELLGTVDSASEKKKQDLLERLCNIVRALFGKGGARICACYRKLLAQKEVINALLSETWSKSKYADYGRNTIQYGILTPGVDWYGTEELDIEAALGKVLHHSIIVNPDPELQALALELYQDGNPEKANVNFLPAAATVKFSQETFAEESCTDWLERQIPEKELLMSGNEGKRMKAVIEAADYIRWTENGYKLYGEYIDVYFINSKNKSVERPFKLPNAKEIIRWFAKYGTSQAVNRILAKFVPLADKALRREMGAYFYRKALTCLDNQRYNLVLYMKIFGWTNYNDLAVSAVKNDPSISSGELYNWLVMLSKDKDETMKELRAISRMVKSGEIKADQLDLEDLQSRMELWYQRS